MKERKKGGKKVGRNEGSCWNHDLSILHSSSPLFHSQPFHSKTFPPLLQLSLPQLLPMTLGKDTSDPRPPGLRSALP